MYRFEQNENMGAVDQGKAQALAAQNGLHIAAAQVLCARGIDTAQAAAQFLRPDISQLHDPMLLPDMQAGKQRIERALRDGEKIAVFCDYDADGTCGGCALYLHLKETGGDALIMTPNRHKEGYGLSAAAVDEIDAGDCSLIITVDCGITNVEEVAHAKQLGIDVIITDHHECGPALPDSEYIINPKRPDSEYPCPYIAGCGVAFKLIHALAGLDEAMKYIDLFAVGTITDIVPLLGENRAIAYFGIGKMRQTPSAGIAALARAAGTKLSSISSYGVSFGLGPRINAAGRMDTAQLAIDILRATRPSAQLDALAKKLCALNDARRNEVSNIVREAENLVGENEYMRDRAILLANEQWNTGVIGIAAAKIAEKYTRPCVLFGGAEGSLVGSARSITGINMHEVLGQFADRYEKFGGHAQAAGLTIRPDVLNDLRKDVCAYIDETYDEEMFAARHEYDLALGAGDISGKLVHDLNKLEPFGHSNDKPVIAVMGADISDTKYVGKNGQPHLKFTMRQGSAAVDAVNFFFKEAHSFISRTCDFLGEADINDYNNRPQIIVRKIAAHYDKRLMDSFIYANRARMAQRFIDEIVCLAEKGRPEETVTQAAIGEKISAALSESRFGLCIIADTQPALRWLLALDVVDEAMKDGRLAFFDEKAYSADNCIAASAAAGHDRIIRIGVCGEDALCDDALKKAIIGQTAQMFMDRAALLEAYAKLTAFASEQQRTAEQITQQLGLPAEKAAFALRVFEELDLIERGKSGKILAIKNNGEKKDLTHSKSFAGFERAVRKV